jgi:hypothetical protein
MIWATLAMLCIVFVESFRKLGVARHTLRTRDLSRRSLAVIRAPDLDDEHKERVLQRNAGALLIQTLLFVGKLSLIVVALAGVYLVAVHLLPVTRTELDARLLSPLIWFVMTVFALLYVGIRNVVAKRL